MGHAFERRCFRIATALAVFSAMLVSGDALAWGPLAHLEFGTQAMTSSLLSTSTQHLLARCGRDFLYGTLAADIIVGKNLAPFSVHCHNWTMGFRVLDQARGEREQAFSLGFLAHLAVDTIAHNYFVPYKLLSGFHQRATGHAYWELRYDQQLPPTLWKLAQEVSAAEYRSHDAHLEEVLGESAVIPFSISKGLFGSLLLAARLKKWQAFSRVIASQRHLGLEKEEVFECRKLAVGQVVDLLRQGDQAPCTRTDPTGLRNLQLAQDFRQRLLHRADVQDGHKRKLVEQSRGRFRSAIYGPLELPSLPS